MSTRQIIFLDTETTGFGKCRLVELAYLVDDGIHALVTFRVKPPIAIHEQASALHGVTEEMVKDMPFFQDRPDYAATKELLENSTIVAHNAIFDVDVLDREGIHCPYFIDTKRLAQKKWPQAPNHKLQDLRSWLGIAVEGDAHTAGGDVMVLRALYQRIMAPGV